VSVYKKPSGRWAVRVDLPRDADGIRKQRNLGTFRTRKEAEAVEREALQSLDRGIDLSPRIVTVAEVMRRFLEDREHRCGAKTLERYREISRLYIEPHLGALTLARLRPAHISEWLTALRQRGGKKASPLSPKSVRHAHALLKSSVSWAVSMQLATTNPAAIVKSPPVSGSEVRALTPEEAQAILAACLI
jgi:integrase